jgi:23S rRNA pseudouridine2605 synthase
MGDTPGLSSHEGERVAKVLARAGVCSRRDAERLIAEGRVKLNGRVLDTPAVKVGPNDALLVDNRPVRAAEPARLWRYHKPAGLVTTHRDPAGRPTVFQHLPAGLPRVISVGRLDLNSEGLLLLTNDGELARKLELPATGLMRRYRARAFGRVTQAELNQLKDGITVDGVRYGAIDAKLERSPKATSTANAWIQVSLSEGKNREVRRVLEALGLKVNRLIRTSYGPFELGMLELGAVDEIPRKLMKQALGKALDD